MNNSLDLLKGIGPKRRAYLNEIGIQNISDLVHHFPRRYDCFQSGNCISEWTDGVIIQTDGIVTQIQQYRPRRGMNVLKVTVRSSEKLISLFWFNQPYLKNKFKIGDEILFQGKLSQKGNIWNVSHPKLLSHDTLPEIAFGNLLPIYSLSQNISSSWFESIIVQALTNFQWDEIFPSSFHAEKKFLTRNEALTEIHKPTSVEDLARAKYRFAYEELLFLQTTLLNRRHQSALVDTTGIQHKKLPERDISSEILKNLPFHLTSGQEKSWQEIKSDMENSKPMQRLLQGDVGSGKTIIAALALAKTVENNHQGAFMAPTEILANQHFKSLSQLFSSTSFQIRLLTHNTTNKEKLEILQKLKNGEVDIVIGTHALIQETVAFSSLGLVITDEQHRFGVNQRAALKSKGASPDMLVMTATPIPRTLALTFYGDLEISTIDTMPKGRKEIRTFVRTEESRDKVYQFAYDQIQKGHQVYVVAPAIEENPDFPMRSISELEQDFLKKWGNTIPMKSLHGKLSGIEKKEIMDFFLSGNIKLLLSTTVIEVGIHVPNATVMIVENAERFGLSQLHQLRGRVGRGDHISYCILLSSSSDNNRLKVMEKISDGFLLAEEDLKIRGPGHFFGIQQHGLPDYNLGEFLLDPKILKETREIAIQILDNKKYWSKFLNEMQQRFSYWSDKVNQH